MSNVNKDCFGIIAHATEQLPKLTYTQGLKRNEYATALSKLDNEYTGVLREMLSFIRQRVNGADVKTVDDLLMCFRDSCHALGGIMTRAELIAQPLMRKPMSDRARFADAIRTESVHMCDLDDTFFFSCDGRRANDAAYKAYADILIPPHEDAEILAALPLLSYLNKGGAISSRMFGVFEGNSCADAIVKDAPLWAKRFPLLGYAESWEHADDNDGVTSPLSECYGFECLDISGCTNCTVKINPAFVEIFSDRLMRFYASNDVGNADYYSVLELKKRTHRRVISLFANDCILDTSYIYQALRRLLDLAETGETITNKHFEDADIRIVPITSDILVYKESIREGVTYTLDKDGLMYLVEMVEALQLVDIIPGFDIISDRTRSLA